MIRNPPDTRLKPMALCSMDRSRVVSHSGATKKRPIARATPIKLAINVDHFDGSLRASSGKAMSADQLRVAMPIFSDSNRWITPRKTGNFSHREVSTREVKASLLVCTWPSGSRTATAQNPGTRIMTPSMTAWPP